jgi:transposase
MSVVTMTAEQRGELETAQRQSKNVRHWKRYQAVLLRAGGTPVAVVAQTLGCTRTSVSNWTTAWREAGVAGVREGAHPGAVRRLEAAGEQRLEEFLSSDPQASGYATTGWTVPRHADGVGQGRLARQRAHDPPHAASAGLGLEAAALCAGPVRSRFCG